MRPELTEEQKARFAAEERDAEYRAIQVRLLEFRQFTTEGVRAYALGWLAYQYYGKHKGPPLRAAFGLTEAEATAATQQVDAFMRQLDQDARRLSADPPLDSLA